MKNIVLFYKKDPKISGAARKIRSAIPRYYKVTMLDSTKKLQGKFDIMVAVGGDGTILRGVRMASPRNIPVLGVNLGRIGFLSEIKPNEIKAAIKSIDSGAYEMDERMMIQAELFRNGKKTATVHALNDIVTSKSGIARLAKFTLSVDNEIIRDHHADGIIISTPTGSTAYNISVGGPIVYPIYPMFIISAICPHSMSDRPLVIPARRDKRLVTVKIAIKEMPGQGGKVLMTSDGQHAIQLKARDELVITESPFKAKFIRLKKYHFFKVLREKLRWT